MILMEACAICARAINDDEPKAQLRLKGCENINLTSQLRGDNITVSPGQKVHQCCRRDYINPRTAKPAAEYANTTPKRALRSSAPEFNLRENCLFCGKHAKLNEKKRGPDVFPVRTIEFRHNLEAICMARKDEWALTVQNRLQMAPADLHAADAVYHQQCSVNFRTGKMIPLSQASDSNEHKKSTPGRPKNSSTEEAFLKVVRLIEEGEEEQLTISDLVKEMERICGSEAYSSVYMKKKVIDHFGKSVVITDLNGKPNVITLTHNASAILHEFYDRPKIANEEEEKRQVILTAAKLIKADIKSIDSSFKSYYPSSEYISSFQQNLNYVPETLQLFLKEIFSQVEPTVKITTVGQAIIQACRPKSHIAPLQIGLGVQMHHHFGSKFLIETLNNLGFCSSYKEVHKFEVNAAASSDRNNMNIDGGSFIQYVADNVDHNLRTLDGHGTFHGMGIIASVTPGMSRQKPVPRVSPNLQEVVDLAKINIAFYKSQNDNLSELKYEVLKEIVNNDNTWKIDLLSRSSWPLRSLRPSWSAMMYNVMTGTFPGKSSIIFLPLIDMNPSDTTCIYSTLHFVCKEAKKNNVSPILTFDQPLYWKALTIIENESKDSPLKDIVLKLGGFHTQMSFLGSIGHIMSGSGLAELMELVYAPTAVTHMLTGKAVARAVRGHFLVDTALTALIMNQLYGVPIPGSDEREEDGSGQSNQVDNSDYTQTEICDEIAELLDSLMERVASVDMVCKSSILDTIRSDFEDMKSSQLEYRTSRLWFQYLDMIDILRRFIKAERTGNWQLHLQAVQEMLPYLAAAGHNLYVKSLRIYLQKMQRLETENHEVFEFLQSGYNVIRRSNAYWSGISSDLAIEQSLMRSIKSTGGMTRGRGMSESQRAQWILSMPDCSDVNNAMQEYTNVNYSTSSQHKETGTSRRNKDSNDIQILASYLTDRNPFLKESTLRNIETGVTADSNVNADNAREVGTAILQSMDGKTVKEHVFKRNQHVITLGQKSAIKMNDETISVDPQLLFQRFIAAADNICEDKAEIFTYELCAYPSAMFESSGFMRSAQKSTLLDAIWTIGDCAAEIPSTDIQYVIDGGSLLHHVSWQSSTTFGQICQKYVNLVQRLKADATVVFDGYCSGPDTKDELHLRRNRGIIGTKVHFDGNTPFKSKKDTFMSNRENKQNFINMLSEKLVESGFETKHAEADADVLIADTAISNAASKTTILLGEDTDLLVLLLFHANNVQNQLIFKSDSQHEKTKIWDITKTRAVLGEPICRVIPVLHAITGCDTTSRFFGIGKTPILKKVMGNNNLKILADVFLSASSSKESVIAAGESLICALYNGLPNENLDVLRYRKFVNRVTISKTYLQIHTLPPTSAAAAYHSLRTFYQVQTWTEKQLLNPREWGWMLSNEKLFPIKTNKAAAPEHILRMIRCQCKTNCETKRCNCRKHGMACSTACGDCKGISCTNSPKPITDELCD